MLLQRLCLGACDGLKDALRVISELDGEVLTGPERRRRWSLEQKLSILAEEARLGASAVARRHGLSRGLVYTWRRRFHRGEFGTPAFLPAEVIDTPLADAPVPDAAESGVMVIELGGGRRVRVDRHVDAAALRRVLSVLEGR
jgi:transposase